jgi:hypothetical protein
VDKSADINKAVAIAFNAKVQRPTVCNALDTVLVHADVAQSYLPLVAAELGKAGVELVLLRPDGRKTQKFIEYPKSDFKASTEKADVKVGNNYLRVDYSKWDLPVYEIHLDEKELGFEARTSLEDGLSATIGWFGQRKRNRPA